MAEYVFISEVAGATFDAKLTAAIADVTSDSSKGIIVIDKDGSPYSYSGATPITVPPDVTLIFQNGVIDMTGATGNLVIEGPIVAPDIQIFDVSTLSTEADNYLKIRDTDDNDNHNPHVPEIPVAWFDEGDANYAVPFHKALAAAGNDVAIIVCESGSRNIAAETQLLLTDTVGDIYVKSRGHTTLTHAATETDDKFFTLSDGVTRLHIDGGVTFSGDARVVYGNSNVSACAIVLRNLTFSGTRFGIYQAGPVQASWDIEFCNNRFTAAANPIQDTAAIYMRQGCSRARVNNNYMSGCHKDGVAIGISGSGTDAVEVTDVDEANNRVTVASHNFGPTDSEIELTATTTDTLPTGLAATVLTWKVIDSTTLECVDDTFSDDGVGTHTLTPSDDPYYLKNDIVIDGNRILDCWASGSSECKPIFVRGGDMHIVNNHIEGNTGATDIDNDAIYVQITPTGYQKASVVANNKVINGGNYGISVKGGPAIVDGNYVEINSDSVYEDADNAGWPTGIELSGCDHTIVSNNIVRGWRFGINVETTDDQILIDGNHVYETYNSSGSWAFYCRWCGNDLTVTNNHFEGSVNGGRACVLRIFDADVAGGETLKRVAFCGNTVRCRNTSYPGLWVRLANRDNGDAKSFEYLDCSNNTFYQGSYGIVIDGEVGDSGQAHDRFIMVNNRCFEMATGTIDDNFTATNQTITPNYTE